MFARSLFAVLPLLALVSATSTSSPNRLVERQTGASRIQSLTQENLCVTVMGGQPVAGATIQIAHCFDDSDQNASLQKFTCSEADEGGFLSIALECSPNLCIDRGSDGSEDGSGLQLQECIVGTSSAQKWQHDDTQIFSYFDQTQKCLDIQDGSQPYYVDGEPYGSERSLQTWPCFEGNTNQMWNLVQA